MVIKSAMLSLGEVRSLLKDKKDKKRLKSFSLSLSNNKRFL